MNGTSAKKDCRLIKLLPLTLMLLSLLLFFLMIAKHEHHLKHSTSLYVKLAPLDPRSLIQGDYMALNYELMQVDATPESAWAEHAYHASPFYNQRHLTLWVETDSLGRVTKSAFDKNQLSTQAQPLLITNPDNTSTSLYPAANSFMFAEGLAGCYETAAYAHLRIDGDGAAILADLVADDLTSLNCEARAKAGELF